MKIGDIELKYGLMLAPMAGFSDIAMRKICRDHGAEMCVSEMVSAKAVCYGDRKTYPIACLKQDELPSAVQIFGSEPEIMAQAAQILSRGVSGGVAPSSIDINMGCPVHKIVSNGEGSALMKKPSLVYEIVSAVRDALDIPITVKIRSGWDATTLNAVEVALAAERAGAAAVCVHGRTRGQMYSGHADLSIIKNVKDSLSIPVIGNGDIRDASGAVKMLSECGCDGVAVARGAIGNPFIFSEIRALLEGREYTPPTLSERISTAMQQLEIAAVEKGEFVAVRESRKQIALYIQGFPGAAAMRAKINFADSVRQISALFEEVAESQKKLSK